MGESGAEVSEEKTAESAGARPCTTAVLDVVVIQARTVSSAELTDEKIAHERTNAETGSVRRMDAAQLPAAKAKGLSGQWKIVHGGRHRTAGNAATVARRSGGPPRRRRRARTRGKRRAQANAGRAKKTAQRRGRKARVCRQRTRPLPHRPVRTEARPKAACRDS